MEEKKIYKALTAIQKEIGAIAKDSYNQGQRFYFRGIDAVMNTLHPLLAEYGVTVIPEVTAHHREERKTERGGTLLYSILTVKFHFTAMDGSEVVATVVGEGMDSGDKATNKAMAVAYKYAMFQTFCIPTEEMAKADPDAYNPEPSRIDPDTIRKYIDNCQTLDEFQMMKDNWGGQIKADPDLAAYANAAYKRIKEGGQQ